MTKIDIFRDGLGHIVKGELSGHTMCGESGSDIVCLPNRLIIHFLGVQEIDAISG